MPNYNTFLSDKPHFNEVYDIKLAIPDTFAVTLDEVKSHLNILTTETYDDAYINILIPASQSIVERYISQTLTSRQVSCKLSNPKGWLELPYGPYQSLVSIKSDDCSLTDSCYCIEGVQFKVLGTYTNDITIEYMAGYDSVPSDIKLALLQEIGYRYNNRGNVPDETGVCKASKSILNSHRRLTWL